jgi:hypothetical protein
MFCLLFGNVTPQGVGATILNFQGAQESILPAYVAWRGRRYDKPIRTRFLAPLDCSKNSSTGTTVLYCMVGA